MTLILQDIVLNQARRDKLKVKLTLCDGSKILGTVRGFDNFTIIIDIDEKTQTMIYKYNIITITPENPVLIDSYNSSANNND